MRNLLTLLALAFLCMIPGSSALAQHQLNGNQALRNAAGYDGMTLISLGDVGQRNFALIQGWNDSGVLRWADAGHPMPVQLVAGFPGPVNLVQINGTAVSVNEGTNDAGTQRVIEAQPTGHTDTVVDPNQAGAENIAANTARIRITCQNVGTDPAMVRLGSNGAGTTGQVIGGGAAANDGTGGVWFEDSQESVYFYDLLNNGNADLQCFESTSS